MRTRHPFNDVLETEPPQEVVIEAPVTTLKPHSPADPVTGQSPVRWHTAENRRQRRKGVATFAPSMEMPKAEAKGLRRKLLKQRQVKARGKLDVETRRLQRKALSK